MAIVLLALAVLSWSRTSLWHDEVTFWSEASRGSDDPLLRMQLAWAYDGAGRSPEAAEIYEGLLRAPENLDAAQRQRAATGLGVALAKGRRYAEAAAAFEQAVALAPEDAGVWFNLANALWPMAIAREGESVANPSAASRCLQAIRRAAALSPGDA